VAYCNFLPLKTLIKVACVASVSVRCRSKERGTRVKDHAKNGASKRASFIFWLSFHFSRGQNRSFFAPKPGQMETLATQAMIKVAIKLILFFVLCRLLSVLSINTYAP